VPRPASAASHDSDARKVGQRAEEDEPTDAAKARKDMVARKKDGWKRGRRDKISAPDPTAASDVPGTDMTEGNRSVGDARRDMLARRYGKR
jgi:hypothetical protein